MSFKCFVNIVDLVISMSGDTCFISRESTTSKYMSKVALRAFRHDRSYPSGSGSEGCDQYPLTMENV